MHLLFVILHYHVCMFVYAHVCLARSSTPKRSCSIAEWNAAMAATLLKGRTRKCLDKEPALAGVLGSHRCSRVLLGMYACVYMLV